MPITYNSLMGDNPKFQGYPVLPMSKDIRDDIVINKEKYGLVFDGKYRNWVKDNGSASSGDLYTGTALTDVGGISNGQSFVGATMQEMWDSLLRPEMFPTLVNPSITFNHNQASLVEIGSVINIIFTADFNRGSISPTYGTSGFRSGPVNGYNYTGVSLPSSVTTTDDPRNDSITGYIVLSGANTWTASADYDVGEQPLSNKGNPYNSPLPAGTTGASPATFTGVYPRYGTSVNITTLTKQALQDGGPYEFTSVAENGGDKEKCDIVDTEIVSGIMFYNTVSGSRERINGSQASSLTAFTISSVNHMVQGNIISYNRYTHNSIDVGERQLRFII